jgi:ketosteroid isomerase-like protein
MQCHRTRQLVLTAIAACLVHGAATATAATAPTPAAVRMSADECAVWNRELAFAHSVETHDAVAFASFVHPQAAFNAGTARPTRGRAAIVADWSDLIVGRTFHLRWHPGFVAIAGDPRIAVSSGPAWTDDITPNANPRYTISRFTSTWLKGDDGVWRVLFDGAGAPPQAASADDIARLVAAQTTRCPGG